jgi:hypothetical protein
MITVFAVLVPVLPMPSLTDPFVVVVSLLGAYGLGLAMFALWGTPGGLARAKRR